MAGEERWKLDDEAARFYERTFVPALFAPWAPVLVDAAGVAPGQLVLDVACGTGVVARLAAERVRPNGFVVGLDANPSMLREARRVAPALEWQQGDAAALPCDDDDFDCVLCQAGLMFFSDRVAALREMRRVVAPGGTVAVLVWGRSDGYERVVAKLEQIAGPEAADLLRAPFCLSDPAELRAVFEAAGMASANLATRSGSARFGSVEEMVRADTEGWVLRGWVDPQALIRAVADDLAPFVDPSGRLAMPMEAHVVTWRRARAG